MNKSCEKCSKSFATPYSFRRHMFTQHNTGKMLGWNENKTVKAGCLNQSSVDVAHTTPNVIHVAHIRPNVADGTPNVAHVTHVAPDIAQETLGVTPNVNNVMPIVTAETAQEKCLSSDAAHSLRQISPPCLKVSSNLDNAFVLRHPFMMLLAGPTSCGKTTWMKHLLQQDETMIRPPDEKILWFYKRWQPAYTELQELFLISNLCKALGNRILTVSPPCTSMMTL